MDFSVLLSLVALMVVAAVSAVFLRESRMKTTALLLMLAAGVLVMLRLLPYLSSMIETLSALSDWAGVNASYLSLLLKIIGVAYIAEFGAQLCRDAGEGAAAMKVEMAARVAIVLLALPMLTSVVSSVLELLS